VIISGSGSGLTNVLLTPGPGVGYIGTVSLSCSGLPTGSTCAFQPALPNLNGSTPLTVALTITKPPEQSAAIRAALRSGTQRMAALFAGATIACAFFFALPRKKRAPQLIALFFLSSFLGVMCGCQGGASVSSQPTGPFTSTTSFVVTVTATGGAGAQAVSHSVTLGVTLQ
jgi:hypothetical protein